MNEEQFTDVGILRLNGETYRLMRPENMQVAYQQEYVSAPPYEGGEPAELVHEVFTWHQGGFKSRAGIVGTSEYGENTDGFQPLRLLPGPKVIATVLDDTKTFSISWITDFLGYIWVCAGRYIYRFDNNFIPVLSKDFGAGVTSIMAAQWKGLFYVTTDAATNSLWRLDSLGTPDTWTQTGSVEAYRLAAGINRLFKVTKDSQLSNIRSNLDPMTDTNWADNVPVGSSALVPTALESYERTVLVGKSEGLYSVGEEGYGIREIQRMQPSTFNCQGMKFFDPHMLIPHARGTFRWAPGDVQSVGPEVEILNQSPVRGPVTTIQTDGTWIYFWVQSATTTVWLCRAREKVRPDSFGPYTMDTWVKQTGVDGQTVASHFTAGVPLQGVPARLWWSAGRHVFHVDLGSGGGMLDTSDPAYRFTTSNSTRFSSKINFDDRNAKFFRRVEVEVSNATVSRYAIVAYSIDGGAFVDLDFDGNQMIADSNGINLFYLPVSAVGLEIQIRLTLVNNSETSPIEVRSWKAYAVPQAKKVSRISATVLLQEGFMVEGGFELRSVVEQQNDLIGLLNSAVPVSCTGPWGEGYMTVKDFKILSTVQSGFGQFSHIVQLALQERAGV